MDAAIARLNGSRGYTRDIIGLSPIPGVDMPALGMNVVKSGRTTGVTQGIIDGLSFSGTINYDHGPNSFHDQIHITPRPPWPAVDYEVSKGGDSGSVWINEGNGKAVGLHFGGETDPAPISENALANPMHKVAAASGLNFAFTPLFFCGFVVPKKPWLDPVKAFRADLPPKSLIDPVKLPGLDVGMPFWPGLPVMGGGGGLLGRGGPAPFILATPHHFGEPFEESGSEAAWEAALAQIDATVQHYQALREQLAAALGGRREGSEPSR